MRCCLMDGRNVPKSRCHTQRMWDTNWVSDPSCIRMGDGVLLTNNRKEMKKLWKKARQQEKDQMPF